MDTCGKCRHWQAHETLVNLGICQRVVMSDEDDDPKPCDPAFDNHYLGSVPARVLEFKDAVVVDGSDFFAALLTRNRFGCTLFSPGPTKTISLARNRRSGKPQSYRARAPR